MKKHDNKFEIQVHSTKTQTKTRIFIHITASSVLEHILSRYVNPVKLYKKFLPTILQQSNMAKNLTIKWSQKAGCQCGCSPGFIVEGHQGQNLFVTIPTKILSTIN